MAARIDIDAALASLPVEFRTAVVLRDVCDLPYDEIAVILAVPVGTVRSRIARARSALAATWQTGKTGSGRDGERTRTTARDADPGTSPAATTSEPERSRQAPARPVHLGGRGTS